MRANKFAGKCMHHVVSEVKQFQLHKKRRKNSVVNPSNIEKIIHLQMQMS